MKVLMVMTDSYSDCEKAIKYVTKFIQKLQTDIDILVVLEDVFNLERASTTLGMPVPPEVKSESVRRIERKLKELWLRYEGSESFPEVEYKVGPLHEEVKKFIENKDYELILWACYPSAYLCKIIDELNTASLIIK